jgi:hypothetical protein
MEEAGEREQIASQRQQVGTKPTGEDHRGSNDHTAEG